jgi:hypothetical protein
MSSVAATLPPINVTPDQRAVCYHPETGELYAASDPAAWEFYKANYRRLGNAIAYATCNRMPEDKWRDMVVDPVARMAYSRKLRQRVG